MQLERNKPLNAYNTFGFNTKAEMFVEAQSIAQAQEAIEYSKKNALSLTILGDGSNVVLTDDIPGLTLKMATSAFFIDHHQPGAAAIDDNKASDNNTCSVIAEAGVNWHQFVLATIEQQAFGLENLSLIPGTVGAAPIQNIGAYGVEISSSLSFVECIDCESNQLQVFDRDNCEFAYRDSIFKRSPPLQLGNAGFTPQFKQPRFLITRVGFTLQKQFEPQLSYAALANEIALRNLDKPDAQTVSNIVCDIRRSKLPDPAKLGNAGSFFKNPIISLTIQQDIQKHWPDAPCYPQADGTIKIAAAWLLETAGWKGKKVAGGTLGVHDKQALVLVNHGGGNGQALIELATEIKNSVKDMFGIELEQEPRTLPEISHPV